MTQTAAALETLSGDRFEDLASAVLRRAKPAYARLIHTGKNTKGDTVKSPVDGIFAVPGSNPPHFVIFHYTTDERLNRKWLHRRTPKGEGSKTPDGDVIKAVHWTEKQRTVHPETRVTLVLACNQRPDENLVSSVKQICILSKIDVEIWEFSYFLDYLDNDSDGQWLRKKYLGIDQERLSADLLREISLRSCDSYAAHERLCGEATWIDRSLDEELHRRLMRSSREVTLLVMGSGEGKSTASYRLLRKHLDAGGFGLWIEPRFVEQAMTVEGAVEATLKSLYPTLETGSGARASELSAQGEDGLLLVVDDVNRVPQPSSLVRRIEAWSQSLSPSYRILCPVWPQVLDPLLERSRETLESLCFYGEGFSLEEGIAAVERKAELVGRKLTRVETEEIATDLGNDPLLIDLWGEAQTQIVRSFGAPVAFSVVESFIQRRLRALAGNGPEPLLEADYWGALRDLSREMLLNRRLFPLWREVEEWLRDSPERLRALRHLLLDRSICRQEGEAGQILFRHDRVRDLLLARTLRNWMKEGYLPDSVLTEPHYAEILGMALAATDLELAWAERYAAENPLALVCALRIFRVPESPLQETIVEHLREWFSRQIAEEGCVRSLRWAVLRQLARTDSPVALELTGYFRESSLGTWHARFRNGDVEAGSRLCVRMGLGAHVGWVGLLARHVADRLGPPFIRDLLTLLVRPDLPEDLLVGGLHLAGWLAEPDLLPTIEVAWNQTSPDPYLLASFLWAAARCSRRADSPVLSAMFTMWRALPNESSKPSILPERVVVADHLQRAFAEHPPDPPILQGFIAQGENENLHWSMIVTLKHINHPGAVAFIAQSAARADREAEAAGRPSHAELWSITRHWDPRMYGSQRLGNECLAGLRELWKSEESDPHLKRYAFSLWLTQAGVADLPVLQAIVSTSPLYELALTQRIWLGDRTVAANVISQLSVEKYPDYCWWRCERIWCEELKIALDSYLGDLVGKLPEDWDFKGIYHHSAELLQEIPKGDAQELLLKHWSHLGRSYAFVQAALCIGTPDCLRVVAEAVKKCPEPAKLLQHLNSRLGLRDPEREKRISDSIFEAVQPYLALLGEYAVQEFWLFCQRRRRLSWRHKYLEPLLSPALREQFGLEEEALFSELDRYAVKDAHQVMLEHWLEKFAQRGDPPDRWRRILADWLRKRGTISALKTAGKCLTLNGNRRDLALLETAGLSLDDHEVARIFEDTRFAVYRRTLD
jgi:hypothetical protein